MAIDLEDLAIPVCILPITPQPFAITSKTISQATGITSIGNVTSLTAMSREDCDGARDSLDILCTWIDEEIDVLRPTFRARCRCTGLGEDGALRNQPEVRAV